ncbi:MAG: DUF6576 domain-containing protein [Acidimicrobiales bacterium]
MRPFNAGRFGNSDDPWFRVGTIDVTTTIAVVGMGLISMFIWAAEGRGRGFSKYLWLVSKDIGTLAGGSVLGGQVWRLVTWPIPNEPDFWTLILFAVFFMLGSQMEALMGRRLFTIFLLSLTVIPGVLVTIFELVSGVDGLASGLRFIEVGVLISFAMHNPNARFWPGIPAWGIAIGIVVLDFLQIIGGRDNYSLVLLFCVVLTAMFMTRSMGFAEKVDWLPKLPLPASLGGEPSTRSADRGPNMSRPARKRGKGKLRAVPPVDPAQSDLADMEIDALLDQVANEGLDSLSKEQRKRLEQHSKRLRKRDE